MILRLAAGAGARFIAANAGDLTALKQLLVSAINAQTEDPRSLRQHIAELERLLRARSAEVRIERIEVPVVTHEEIAELHEIADGMRALVQRFEAGYSSIIGRLAATWQDSSAAEVEPGPTEPVQLSVAIAGSNRAPTRQRPLLRPAKPPSPLRNGVSSQGDDDAGVTGPQRRILDALAAFEAVGLTHVARSNVPSSAASRQGHPGFTNNLGALRSRGLVDYPAGGRVGLTEAGRVLAGPVESIRSLKELHQAWFKRLSGP